MGFDCQCYVENKEKEIIGHILENKGGGGNSSYFFKDEDLILNNNFYG